MPEDVAARRALAAVSISPPSGNGLLAELPGSRMSGLTFGSTINFGFHELSFRLLSRGGEEYLLEAEAAQAQNLWRFGRVRLSMGGEPCWEGSVTRIDPGDWRDDPRRGLLCTVDVTATGLYELDQRREPSLPWTPDEEEEISVAGDEIVREGTASLGGLIAQRYGDVLGPGVATTVVDDIQKRWYDHIMDAVKLGTADGKQVWFGVFFAADGPVLRVLGGGPARWRLSIVGSGVRFPWDGAEYFNRGRALWSSEEAQLVTDDREYPQGRELHHGVDRDATITLDRVAAAGADAGLDTFLLQHLDPRAPVGSLRVAADGGQPYASVRGRDGGAEPGWRVRAGDPIWLHDLLPSDPRLSDAGRVFGARSARCNVDDATLEVEIDQRAVASRRNERPAVISVERGALEPGGKGNVIVRAKSVRDASQNIGRTPEQVLIIGGDGDVEFSTSRAGIYHVHFGGTFDPSLGSSGHIALGFSLDDEVWDSGQRKRTVRAALVKPGTGTIPSMDTSLDGERPVALSRGTHILKLWARDTTGGGPLDGVHVRVRG